VSCTGFIPLWNARLLVHEYHQRKARIALLEALHMWGSALLGLRPNFWAALSDSSLSRA
jgi:hypothetical protein